MTTDLLPKTRRLISGSACSHELADFADWLLSEGYTSAPTHIHIIYLGQALARLTRPHDPAPREVAEVEHAPEHNYFPMYSTNAAVEPAGT